MLLRTCNADDCIHFFYFNTSFLSRFVRDGTCGNHQPTPPIRIAIVCMRRLDHSLENILPLCEVCTYGTNMGQCQNLKSSPTNL